MFKNKRMVALVLFAVMVLVPFATAFAALPEQDWVGEFGSATYSDPDSELSGAETTATTYAQGGTEGTYDDDLKAAKDAVKTLKDEVAEAEKAKSFVDRYGKKAFYPNAEMADGNTTTYTDEDEVNAVYDSAVEKLDDAKTLLADAEARLATIEALGEVGKALKDAQEAADAELTNIKKAEAVLDVWTNAYEGATDEARELMEPKLKAAWNDYKAIAGELKAEEKLLLMTDDDAKEFLEGLAEADALEIKSEDGNYIVRATKSAPEALNGAVAVKAEKLDNGNTEIYLVDANGERVASKGLLEVCMKTPEGVKAPFRVKVDGKFTTFEEDNGYLVFSAEFTK